MPHIRGVTIRRVEVTVIPEPLCLVGPMASLPHRRKSVLLMAHDGWGAQAYFLHRGLGAFGKDARQSR